MRSRKHIAMIGSTAPSHIYPGPILGARYGVPAVQLSPAFVSWDTFEEDNAEFYESLRASESGKAYFATFTSWRHENGIEKDAHDHVPRFVGPCLDPARLAETWTPPTPDSKVLLVSFGTAYNEQPEVYRGVIDQFGGTEWHVVMPIGSRTGRKDLGELPANAPCHPGHAPKR